MMQATSGVARFRTAEGALAWAFRVSATDIVQTSSLRSWMRGGTPATEGLSPHEGHAQAALILRWVDAMGGQERDYVLCAFVEPWLPRPANPGKPWPAPTRLHGVREEAALRLAMMVSSAGGGYVHVEPCRLLVEQYVGGRGVTVEALGKLLQVRKAVAGGLRREAREDLERIRVRAIGMMESRLMATGLL